MKACTALGRAAALAAVLLSLPLSSHAIFRAYVSSTGNDANPCTLQQPCRLLPAALAAVDNGGEIWMLDSANYNTATVAIAKSVTIQAVPGAVGSVVAAGGEAISIAAGGIHVALRNLSIGPFGSGLFHGISIPVADARVHVDRCLITRLGDDGIRMEGSSVLVVVDTVISRNNSGIWANRGLLHVSRTRVVDNDGVGIYLDAAGGTSVTAHVDDSVASGNNNGVVVLGYAGLARLHATRVVASANQYAGFVVNGNTPANGILEVSSSAANGNGTYGFQQMSGALLSAGNNRAVSNGSADIEGDITHRESY